MARRLAVLAAMFVVIASLFWAGVRNLRARRATLAGNHVQLIPANGSVETDASAPDAEGSGLRGKAAPDFTLTSTDGKKVSLSEYKGHPVLVNFWATWCGPCKLEMPWIQEFSTKYKSQGLIVLGLDQDDSISRSDLAGAAKHIGVSYPILMPDEKASKAYGGVDYLPETFYVNKAGQVVAITAGAPSKDQMEATIQQAIAAGGA
ncbi:MAG: redoxin domain-containing protein [Janthinobacterium lividum]